MRRPTAAVLLALLLAGSSGARSEAPASPAGPPSPGPAASPAQYPLPPPGPDPGAPPAPLQFPDGDTIVMGRRKLALQEVLTFARGTHPSLQAAAARYQQAEARVRQSLASNVPNVYLEVSRFEDYVQGPAPTNSIRFSPSMNLNYKLFDGELRNRTVDKNRQDLLTYEYDWRTKWRELSLQIQEKYLDVVLQKALLDVSEANVRRTDDALRYAQGLVRGGRKSRIDILQAQSDLSGARAEWVQQRATLNQAWATLEATVGAPLNLYATLDDLLGQEPTFPSEGKAADQAFQNRSDLLSLANKVEVQRLQVKVNDTAMNPTLEGVLKYGGLGADFPMGQTWQTGLDLKVPLNTRNYTESLNQEVRANASELEQQAETLRLQIRGNLRNDFIGLFSASERVRIAAEQVEQARDAYSLAERRYRTGISQYVELIQARTVLNQAQGNRERARSDRRLAGFRLANEMEEVP